MRDFLIVTFSVVLAVSMSLWLVSSPAGQNLGATITQISGSDQLSDLDTLINTVSSELNDAKLDNTDYYATTTHATITSIPNLVTVGTIGTGTWEGDTVDELFGGTGFATYTTGDVLYSSAANTLAKLGIGSEDQVLTVSAGGVPEWASGSTDETLAYNWTGLHQWTGGASSTVFSVFDTALFGGTATSTFDSAGNLDVVGTFSAPGGTTATTTVFTASGTWVKPASVDRVKVTVVGGGGGGGGVGDNSGEGAGAGGGAAAYCEAWVDVSGNVTVTVGSGGSGGSGTGAADGSNGSDSSFAGDITVTAGAGSGGDGDFGNDAGAGNSGGSGGSCTNADLSITGQSGDGINTIDTNAVAGDGGSGVLGQGGRYDIGSNTNGENATGYGAGGSGAYQNTGTTQRTGGNGSNGVVIVEWQEY